MEHRTNAIARQTLLADQRVQQFAAPRCCLCSRHVLPPVRSCSKGHVVCTCCVRLGGYCPGNTCYDVLVHRPALDQLARNMPLPCFYRCGRFLHCDALPQHEWRCSMRRPLVRHVSRLQKCRQFCTNMYCVFALFLFIFINYSR